MRGISTDPAEYRDKLGCEGATRVMSILADFRAARFLAEVPGLPISVSIEGGDHKVSWLLSEGMELVVNTAGTVAFGEDGWKKAYRVRVDAIVLNGGEIE